MIDIDDQLLETRDFIRSIDDFLVKLLRLEYEILDGKLTFLKYKLPRELHDKNNFHYFWRGAGAIITDEKLVTYTGRNTLCYTPYASKVSSLLVWCARNQKILNHMNKYALYIGIAEKINEVSSQKTQAQSEIDLYLIVIDTIKSFVSKHRMHCVEDLNRIFSLKFSHMFGKPEANSCGWKIKKFAELGTWLQGSSNQDSIEEYFSSLNTCLTKKPLEYLFQNNPISTETLTPDSSVFVEYYPKGALVFGLRQPHLHEISKISEPHISNKYALGFIPNSSVDIDWLIFSINYQRDWYTSQLKGTRSRYCNIKTLKELKISLPPIEKQMEYKKLIEAFRDHIKKPSERREEIIF